MAAGTITNIAAYLPALARAQPYRPAVVCPAGRERRNGRPRYTQYTYQQLDAESDRLARGLAAAGIGKGVRTVLMVRPDLDFFALTFALFKAGAVLVAVDPGIGRRNLATCLREAEPAAFIGVPAAHLARRVLGWARRTLRVSVVVGPGRPLLADLDLDDLRRRGGDSGGSPLLDTGADDTAAILFTSGSTGPPKGAVYSHANFDAQVRALRAAYGIEPGEIDLATFPLFALFAPALGMTAVVPEMDFTRPGQVDPRRIVEAIEGFGVTNLFASPALLRRVADWGGARKCELPSLRRVISAGAPVPAATLASFTALLAPGAQVFTPYGATESLPVCSIGSDEVLGDTRGATDRGEGICVGRPVGGVSLRIVAVSEHAIAAWSDDLALAVGEIGEIVVRGPVVTARYHNRPDADRMAKIHDPRGGFWHRMGDVGYLDATGRLWYCGRMSQRVVAGGEVLYTIPCEAVFNTCEGVQRTALVGVSRNGVTTPVCCVELEHPRRRAGEQRIRRALRALAAAHRHTQPVSAFLFHPRFPVDRRHNAKIGREELARWAARKLS